MSYAETRKKTLKQVKVISVPVLSVPVLFGSEIQTQRAVLPAAAAQSRPGRCVASVGQFIYLIYLINSQLHKIHRVRHK